MMSDANESTSISIFLNQGVVAENCPESDEKEVECEVSIFKHPTLFKFLKHYAIHFSEELEVTF